MKCWYCMNEAVAEVKTNVKESFFRRHYLKIGLCRKHLELALVSAKVSTNVLKTIDDKL